MPRRTPPRRIVPPGRPPRVLGYGGGYHPRAGPVQPPRRSSFWVELAVWLATTALAGALLLLLASHELLLALPVVLAYALISWLLWGTRRRQEGRARR
ncbi:MAG: hypothetical protein HYY02_09300 [Chloroflexi bacterium]|nr:hypothetical protein [Chloroflexota bacterium]